MADKEQNPEDLVTNMAGPETQRDNLKYEVPLPKEGTPVYFGGEEYMEQHKDGFSPEEIQKAQEVARRQFDPQEVGQGRVQNWEAGLPDRNQQGLKPSDLADVTTSSIVDDPTLGDINRQTNGQKPGLPG